MTTIKCIFLLVISLLTSLHSAWGEVVTIPLHFGEKGYIYIDGKVEGKKATFLLDTGSSPSMVLKKQFSDPLQLKTGDGEVPNDVLKDGRYITGFAAEITTSGKPFPPSSSAQETAIAADLDPFKIKDVYDGIVGMAWFEGYSMVLDCHKKVLTLYSGEDSPELSGVGYVTGGRIRGGNIEALLHFSSGDEKKRADYFLLDTGAEYCMLKAEVLEQFPRKKARSESFYTFASSYKATIYNVRKLTFGNFNASDFDAIQSDRNIPGVLFIKQFRVYISADRKTIGFFTF